MSYFWHTPTTKPLPSWLLYVLFWLFIFPIVLGYVAWGWIRLAVTRPHRETPNG